MNYKMIGKFMAQIFALEAVFMLPAAAIALHDGDTVARDGFLLSAAGILLFAAILYILCRQEKREPKRTGRTASWTTISGNATCSWRRRS